MEIDVQILKLLCLLFHWKLIMHQQDTINEKVKMIWKKCTLRSTRRVIWGCHCMIVEEAGLQRCCAVWLGSFVPKFWRNFWPSPARLWVNSWTRDRGDEGGTFPSKRREAITQPHSATTQKTWFLNMKTGLQLTISLSFVSFPMGSAARVRTSLCSVSPSLSQVTEYIRIIVALLFKRMLRRKTTLPLSLSLSLSLSHASRGKV